MNAELRDMAFTAGVVLAASGGGVLLGHAVAVAAEASRDVPVLWIAAGMAALGVPLLAWGSRTGGDAP